METTDSGQDTTGPAPRRGGSARAGLLGAIVGAGALVGGLVLATGGAGAQPTSAANAAAPTPADEVVLADDEAIDEEFLAELDEAWANYEACLVDNGLVDEGELEFFEDDLEDGEWDEDWDEEDWDEADVPDGTIVFLEDEDGATLVEFGDGDGSVTVSKVDGDVTVTTDGDVEAEEFTWEDLEGEFIDEGDWEEAFEVCDDALGDLEILEGEYVEEYDLDDEDQDYEDHEDDLDDEEADED